MTRIASVAAQEILDSRGNPTIAVAVVLADGTAGTAAVPSGASFRIHHGVADHFRVGRVALAGDAAHDHSPLGGQGMNTGIGDAVALAGALDMAIERGSLEALDGYGSARRPVAKQVVALTNGSHGCAYAAATADTSQHCARHAESVREPSTRVAIVRTRLQGRRAPRGLNSSRLRQSGARSRCGVRKHVQSFEGAESGFLKELNADV